MKKFSANLLFLALAFLVFGECAHAVAVRQAVQRVSCTSNEECNIGYIFPFLECNSGSCEIPQVTPQLRSGAFSQPAGATCTSIRDCQFGLVCISGNPLGTCGVPEGVLGLSHLIVNLIQEDYTAGAEGDPSLLAEPRPTQPTPLLTSRAMAIIYGAAHDAYAILTRDFQPKFLSQRSRSSTEANLRSFSSNRQTFGDQVRAASLIAGFTAARILYPESVARINSVQESSAGGVRSDFASFGEAVGRAVVAAREGDGSERPLTDETFEFGEFLRHQPDPNFPIVQKNSDVQDNLGREWGSVTPFVLSDVRTEAFLAKFPDADTDEYRENLEEVRVKGQCNNITQDGVPIEDIGLFWGYDGAPLIGVPPRLYLQVILAIRELSSLSFKEQLRAFTAVGASMADAGIAAWLWKFEYDLWRPVLGVREDTVDADPEWNPRGVGLTNYLPPGTPESARPPFCVGINPNFPAYPSGHASFGSAAFEVIAQLLGKRPADIEVTFTSDEFNGLAVESTTGLRRRVFTQKISLQEAIDQNKDSRVFIGVHWRFDSEGGEIVGKQIADIAAREFAF